MNALLVGWFSFEQMGATAGDLLARDVVCDWMGDAGITYDVAVAAPFTGGIDWRSVDPDDYDWVVFVCGPFGNGPPLVDLLDRFQGCRLAGVDVSMLQHLDEWNPFDVLIERDSSDTARPDITFGAPTENVPVVGLVQVHPQEEYGERARHAEANAALERLLEAREVAVLPIDTRLDDNAGGLRSPRDVEQAIGRMDAVLTTRLHGLVLALRQGVPVVAIDPIAGGAKVRTQARTIGWPLAFTVEAASDAALSDALDTCLQPETREVARRCVASAHAEVGRIREDFIDALSRPED